MTSQEEKNRNKDRTDIAAVRNIRARARARMAGREAMEKLEEAQEKHKQQKGGDEDGS